MDSDSIQKIKEFLINIWIYLKENKLFVVVFIVALVIVIVTYLYSENYRTKSKVSKLLNTLKYDKKRDNIDYCGVDNSVVDTMYTSVTFDSADNTIELTNTNINLFDLGLSSEYLLNITGSEFNDGIYKVQAVIGKNKLKLDESTLVKAKSNGSDDDKITSTRAVTSGFNTDITTHQDTNVVITYYRPDSKINPYKYKKLTDYYVASSHRSFLVGYQKADYCSLDMINRVLYFGARYIELEIFNKEDRNDSKPVVSSGYNSRLTLNKIDLEDCLKLIGQMAFSETHLLNFSDPLFIFLNLKVNGNQNTINKVAKQIKATLGNRLLHKRFLNTNMGLATLCDLKGKVVIFSSPGWKGSDLEAVVNSGTDSPYLNRLTFNEMRLYSERSKPKTTIRKNTIQILKGSTNSSIEFLDNETDLTLYGINDGDNVVIKGAKRNENNSGNFIFKIRDYSKKKIIFDKAVNLTNEDPGAMVNIDIYDFSYNGEQETIEEYNKNNLTICVPDDNFFSTNYNYKEAMYAGCQFIAMNYQNVDLYMKEYFEFFMQRAFKYKPSSIINTRELPKVASIYSIAPNDKPTLDYEVDYEFIQKYMNKVITISTEAFPNLMLGVGDIDTEIDNTKPPARMILDGDDKNIEFKVVTGKDGGSNTISLMLLDNKGPDDKKLLKFNDNCCFLTYDKVNGGDGIDLVEEQQKLRKMSFIPMKTLEGNPKFNRFGVIMRKTVDDETQEVLYYLKHRKQLSPKFKLFTKLTNEYSFKTILYKNASGTDDDPSEKSEPSNYVVVLTPKIIGNKNFLPLGDIVVSLVDVDYTDQRATPDTSGSTIDIDSIVINTDQSKIQHTMVVNGAAAHPIEFSLLFENRYYKDNATRIQYLANAPLSIWKPIAPDGYTALGVIFQNSYTKPDKESIYCVSNDFIKEKIYEEGFYTNIFDHTHSSINIWKRDSNPTDGGTYISNYVAVKNVRTDTDGTLTPPNPFDNQHYIVNLDTGDYKDRIYIDNVIENNSKDKKSCNFLITPTSQKYKSDDNIRYDKLLEIEGADSKLMSFTKNKGGGNMCMGLPQPYTSSYYKDINDVPPLPKVDNENDSENDSKLMGMLCGDSSNFGTNFKLYNDYSIRLSGNNNNCVTHRKLSNGNVNKDIDDDYNFLFLDKCDRNLQNQLFVVDENRLRVLSDEGDNPNACVTVGDDNTIRLEDCGDQKYTALNLWENQINRDDKCFKDEADELLKELSNVELCEDTSYYVIYLDGIIKNEEFCDKSAGFGRYNELVVKSRTTGIAGVSLFHRGKSLDTNMDEIPASFQSEADSLSLKKGTCSNCKKPSKMMCSKQRLENSVYNSFNTFEEEQRLMDYCITMRDVDDFRCGRSNRQKFIYFPTPEDYCLNASKNVYVQFPEILDSENTGLLNIQDIKNMFKRENNGSSRDQLPVQNLLNEYYNTEHYSVFIKAMLKPNGDNKYKLIFDWDNFSEDIKTKFTPIQINSNSDFICLDYEPKESMLREGSKVLVTFDNFYTSGNGTVIASPKILSKGVKYFGIIVKKLSSKMYKVMLSINSYESNDKMNTKVGVKYYTSNPVMNFDIKDLTLLKKADVCL